MAKRVPYKRYKREDVRVSGVTFCNNPEDGGENRQDVLAELMGAPSMVGLEPEPFHGKDSDDSRTGLKVRSLVNGKIIGFIRKEEAQSFLNDERMIAQIELYKGIYNCTLTRPERPSSKQYGAIRALKRKGIIEELPFYDKTCYQYALSRHSSV